MLSEFLSNLGAVPGCNLMRAGTLAELRASLPGPAPDALLLDLPLPDGDALSALPEVKSNWPDCRVVILTHHALVTVAEEAFKLHEIFLLTKPIDIEMRKTVLSLALGQSKVEA